MFKCVLAVDKKGDGDYSNYQEFFHVPKLTDDNTVIQWVVTGCEKGYEWFFVKKSMSNGKGFFSFAFRKGNLNNFLLFEDVTLSC